MAKSVVLRQTYDEGGSRHLSATLTSAGDLNIEGQDLGSAVELFFGEGFTEYEYALTVRAVDLQSLRNALGATGDLLSALQIHFSNPTAADPRSFLEAHSVRYEFWSRIGD